MILPVQKVVRTHAPQIALLNAPAVVKLLVVQPVIQIALALALELVRM